MEGMNQDVSKDPASWGFIPACPRCPGSLQPGLGV